MPCNIVLVEDNQDDAYLLREGLAAAGFPNRLTLHRGGLDAVDELEWLLRTGEKTNVLILDYHLPAFTAQELLSALRRRVPETLEGVQVMVLGGAITEAAAAGLLELGVHAVFEKPFQLDGFLELGVVLRNWCQEV